MSVKAAAAAGIMVIIAALCLGEIMVRVIDPQETFRSRSRKLMDLWPAMFRDDDNLPFALIPGRYQVRDKSNAIDTVVTINKDGYRGKEISPVKDVRTKRILFVGDSIIFGYGVGDKETLPAFLEQAAAKKLPWPVEVINAGFHGYTSLSYYVYLKRSGLGLRPDCVIMSIFVDNDLKDLALHRIRTTDNEGRPTSVYDKYRAAANGIRVPRYLGSGFCLMPLVRDSQLCYLLARSFDAFMDRVYAFKYYHKASLSIEEQAFEWGNYVSYMDKLCKDNSIVFFAAVICGKDALLGRCNGEYSALIRQLKERNIIYIDIADRLKGRPAGELCFPNDGHLNSTGLKESAAVLADLLAARNELLGTTTRGSR